MPFLIQTLSIIKTKRNTCKLFFLPLTNYRHPIVCLSHLYNILVGFLHISNYTTITVILNTQLYLKRDYGKGQYKISKYERIEL